MQAFPPRKAFLAYSSLSPGRSKKKWTASVRPRTETLRGPHPLASGVRDGIRRHQALHEPSQDREHRTGEVLALVSLPQPDDSTRVTLKSSAPLMSLINPLWVPLPKLQHRADHPFR
jgi:hypothetical protein